ncbi:phospholipase A and acyltransferase 4-like isoform X1 [Alosa alosa]|uniref:phospholipase A and acyltransferase 4-like isoform X1 n=2 Tax=Alosa alosa TaxID=278164 RepID=UPI0020152661|nr:phospholipase A and acyltransferase 4-like isoform X1 [Alosa alosa]
MHGVSTVCVCVLLPLFCRPAVSWCYYFNSEPSVNKDRTNHLHEPTLHTGDLGWCLGAMGCCLSCIYRDPVPGDMVEIMETLYSHWVVYVGDGYVVHFTVPDSAKYLPISKGHIARSKLAEMVVGRSHRVNNYLDDRYEPRPTAVIVEEANAWVGKPLDYNLLLENCEHFVTYLRYGHAESRQVKRGCCVCASCTVVWVEIIKWFKRKHPKDMPAEELKEQSLLQPL